MSWTGYLQEQSGAGFPTSGYSAEFSAFTTSLGVTPGQYLEANSHSPYNYPLGGFSVFSIAAPTGGPAVSTSTGVSPLETSYSLYGHIVPLSVFGVGRIGGEIISGPWIENGLASFIISFGVPADPTGTRDIREIAFDSEVVWTTNGATGVTTTAGGTFTTESFTVRFYQGTLTQAADTLESTHFGADAVAYRPQILLAFSDLPIAATKFRKIPYVSAVIGDGSGDDVNFGEAFERLAYSPWVGWTSAQFETSGVTDGVTSGGLIIAQDTQFLQLMQQFGRFYPKWDILQTDKLRIRDRGDDVSFDIELDKESLTGAVMMARAEPNSVPKVLELSTIDPAADYTIVPSRAQTPLAPVAVSTSVKTESAYLPVIMDAATRMSIVTYAKYHDEVIRKTISCTAMAFGLEIEPGDFVAVTGLGDDFTDQVFRVIETLHGVNYVVEITAEAILRCDLGSGDAHIALVMLLLNFNGADASTTFTDISPSANGTAAVLDAAQVDTAFKQFGSGSGLFNGVGGGLFTPNDGLLYPSRPAWDFGAGQFTIEARIRPTSVTGTRFLVGVWGTAAPNLSWVFYMNGSALSWVDTTNGTSGTGITAGGGTLVINTWQAVAVDYDGTTLRLYIDGVKVASSVSSRTIFPGTQPLAIGVSSNELSFCFNGNMDELRITKGLARYATDTSYTVATAAFPST